MIFPNYAWHPSDQPEVLKKTDKKALRRGRILDFFKLLLTNFIWFPYLFIKFLLKSKTQSPTSQNISFYGICVNLDKGMEQVGLIEELGVKSLQIRFFLSDMENIDKYLEFVKSFLKESDKHKGDDKEIMLTIIQSRAHIEDKELLQKDIKIVFEKFSSITNEFMIGNAINRIKWGFVTIEEYLSFFEIIQQVRDENFPTLKLIGTSVIDFEYHFTIRTLFNGFKIHFDKVASLLYVDRRGSPKNTQYGLFDLQNKVEFLDTIVKSSSKCEDKIYITETNWPLKGTAPYAPTSEKECVSEDDYATYMLEYFSIVAHSQKVQKVFWHQLISAGYGLVDNRDGKIRKTKAFYEFKKMVEENQNGK